MIMRLRIIALAALVALALSSCQGNGKREAPVSGELTIHGLEDGKWTYFSVETGESVGSSTFLSEEEDAAWAQREDWDFAICGDYLKTNGGTSGKGAGGIMRESEHSYQTLTEAPIQGYLTDEVGVVK